MSKLTAALAASFVVVVVAVLAVAVLVAGTGALLQASGASDPPAANGASAGQPALPPGWEGLYQEAAAHCPGLEWSVLAAIGTIESDNGRSTLPGVHSGSNTAGAEGPLQFEPATFAAYATVGPGGATPASPYDPSDAMATAAVMLCANGAGTPSGLPVAVWNYNHDRSYVAEVLTLAVAYQDDASLTDTVVAALRFAAAQLGVPYRWGGTGPTGYDCSGLVQAAEHAAGLVFPRVAQAQYDAGPSVPPTTPIQPGDLLFFGSDTTAVEHVGIYVGAGMMIDAPHTGAVVRVDDAGWSGLVGVTRPGGGTP